MPQKSIYRANEKAVLSGNFKQHLKHLGYSKSSSEILPKLLQDFLVFTTLPIREITPEEIMRFYDYISQRPNQRHLGGLSENYINHYVYALKLFFTWQLEQGNISIHPMGSLQFKRPQSRPREILSIKEINELFKVTKTQLERAILSVFYGCGLRRTEAENLNVKDVDFSSGLLYVRQGKGSKRRAVPMSAAVAKTISIYIKGEWKIYSKSEALFNHQYNERIPGNYLNIIVKRLVKRAGIKKQISLHSLRHSIATHLLQNGLSVDYVRAFLGHKHLESTQVYTKISKHQLFEIC
jgi:integrase/recombinase XerD